MIGRTRMTTPSSAGGILYQIASPPLLRSLAVVLTAAALVWIPAAARASSVVRLLTEQGVMPDSVRAVSRGPFAPVVSNETSEGRAQNRRIEIILRPVDPALPASLGEPAAADPS